MIPRLPLNNAPTQVQPQTVQYFGISVLSSRTMWWNAANFVVAALSMTEIVTLIPARYLPLQAAIVAIVNMWLRTTTVRPVAFIAPGETKGVEVKKMTPPAPSSPTTPTD